VRIHLDTDLGGDTDDACALAMLLGWPGVELVGIATTADPGRYEAHPLDSGYKFCIASRTSPATSISCVMT
jgi:hypothetical protein